MLKRYLIRLLITILIIGAGAFAVDQHVKTKGNYAMVPAEKCPEVQAAIVLGAYVFPDGRVCDMLADRIITAVELYKGKKVRKIIMTGDHGRNSYDEVNSMRRYAEKLGVPTEDIFMDHAGFSTYESMYRARDIFMVDSAVVVTQTFHLPRALYTAESMGLKAVGVKADRHVYAGAEYYEMREIPARLKAFAQIHLLRSKPTFLGEAIPVDGDGTLTHDGN